MDYEKSNFINKNIQMDILSDMAFVSMEGSNLNEDGTTTRYTVSSRTMVKENGEWKILSMTSYPNDSPDGSTPNIYKHKN